MDIVPLCYWFLLMEVVMFRFRLSFLLLGLVCLGCIGSATSAVENGDDRPQAKEPISNMRSLNAIEPVGSFSNIEDNGEKAKGFIVRLWQNGDKIIGTISGSHTLKAGEDMPLGILENVAFDPKEKTLSFDAKMSFGKTSRDMVQFKGKMTDTELKGDLRLSDLACETPCTDVSGVAFKKEDVRLDQFDSEEAWEKHMEPQLKATGPKW